MDKRWCFPPNNGGDEQGLNNSLIETFSDNPLKSLAREICQNSLDAGLKDEKVTVEFKTFSIPSNEFPNIEEMRDIVKDCKNFVQKNVNPKTKRFFENAEKTLNAEKIDFLRISDFNTTGLRGSNKDRGSDWTNLVRSTGSSEKGVSKGGSFGIGKGAPFACSSLRTVFYSTKDIDGLEAGQGVARLISFKYGQNPDGSDKISQGTGFYGLQEEYRIRAIPEMLQLDKNFKREFSGTDIFIAGLKNDLSVDNADFESAVVNEVLDGFMIAIWKGALEIKVNDFVINKKTLNLTIEKFKNKLMSSTILTYELLVSEDTIWRDVDLKLNNIKIGSFRLALAIRYDGNNKISMVRSSGMKIIDKDKLCPALRYVGIALIDGDELNSWLREMENPSHNKWEPKRYRCAQSKELLNALYDTIKTELNDVSGNVFETNIDIEGAGDYLPDPVTEDWKKDKFKLNPNDKLVAAEMEISKKILSDDQNYTEDFSYMFADSNTEKKPQHSSLSQQPNAINKTQKTNNTVQAGENVEYVKKPLAKTLVYVKTDHIRIFCTDKKKQLYRLIFTPTMTSPKGYVAINRVAETTEKMPAIILDVKGENKIGFNKNKIGYFPLEEGKQIKIDLIIEGQEYSAMEVRLYAYKG